jgi:glycosyltransferase involved in cell wall biosynthesis
MKIVFIITGLNTGGAEITLLKLLSKIDRDRFSPFVISLTANGDLAPQFEAARIPVTAIALKNPFNFFALVFALRRIKPDVVHTWMYHSDLFGGLAAYFARVKKIAWCIRNSNLDADKTKLSTRLVVKLCAALSKRLPNKIVVCSIAAQKIHEALGYDKTKTFFIPNGFDLDRFKPDAAARAKIRAELGVSDETPLVGLIARFDPQKNHLGFVKAAAIVAAASPKTRFVLVGKGVDRANETLIEAIGENALASAFFLLGKRGDIPAICAALDVLASSSYGEAFPNAIGEALACGVPCAATKAGDSADIIGDTGKVTEIGDMRALAKAILELLDLTAAERRSLGEKARARAAKNYEIGEITKRYEAFYEETLCAE